MPITGATLASTMAKHDAAHGDEDDVIEVRCPECNALVRIARARAEADFKAKCPNGHEVPLAKAL